MAKQSAAHIVRQRISGCVDVLKLAGAYPHRYPFLLQSMSHAHSETNGLARFDILFAFPAETLTLDADGIHAPDGLDGQGGFLDALDAWWSGESLSTESDPDLPFRGGWFLYLGYELATEVEPGLNLPLPDSQPVAFATRIPAAVIVDRLHNETVLLAEENVSGLVESMHQDIQDAVEGPAGQSESVSIADVHEEDESSFLEAVNKAKQAIFEGEIYQANLSRLWEASPGANVSAVGLYKRLCASNPAPFAGLIQSEGFAIVSSSPERLIRRTGSRLDTRPIAGTRPRSADPAAVEQTHEELLGNPKERAEHIMLIDLERNDLGRVCKAGTVEVDEYMVVENYSHVHHIVSNVTGEALDGLTPGQLIRAVFPGGTITGCPKVRCMEIIRDLEGRPRGAYTGSMGYLNLNGDCDLNILIRTMSMQKNALTLAAGSGVVADSDPLHELNETRAKAKGLLLALAEAKG